MYSLLSKIKVNITRPFPWKQSKLCIFVWSKADKLKIYNRNSKNNVTFAILLQSRVTTRKAQKIDILQRFRRWIDMTCAIQ